MKTETLPISENDCASVEGGHPGAAWNVAAPPHSLQLFAGLPFAAPSDLKLPSHRLLLGLHFVGHSFPSPQTYYKLLFQKWVSLMLADCF